MRRPRFPSSPRAGFTLVELLLALVLGAMVALVLASLLHALLTAVRAQAGRIEDPAAARAALHRLAREISCAFAPPDLDTPAFSLTASADPAEPTIALSFYYPSPVRPPSFPGEYTLEHVTYQAILATPASPLRELRRISVPCAGPLTNFPVTNILLRGNFTLAASIPHPDPAQPLLVWPDPAETNLLPLSVQFDLTLPGHSSPPLHLETLLHAAHSIPKSETPPQ